MKNFNLIFRRIAPLALAFIIAGCAAGCGKSEDATTVNPTQPPATTSAPVSAEPGSTENANGMMLTTQYGQTVPTVITTAFDPAVPDPSATTIPGDGLTVPTVTAPVVVTDVVPTTAVQTTAAITTLPDVPTEEFNPTEPSATNEDGEEVSATDKDDNTSETVDNSDEGELNRIPYSTGSAFDGSNLTIYFDYGDWDRIKSQKATVKVTFNGKTKSKRGTINGTIGDEFTFIVDISDMNVPDDDYYIEIAFAKGSIKTINGKQANQAFTVIASSELS